MEGDGHPLEELLSRNEELPREEPEVSRNIGEQLKHMDPTSWPVTLRRRARDLVARKEPTTVVEVGAGIGHLSSWLFDHWTTGGKQPARYQLVEEGGKFGVILKRVIDRYEAHDWAEVVIGDWNSIVSDSKAWHAANATDQAATGAGKSPLPKSIDLIILQSDHSRLLERLMASMPLLTKKGLLITAEPEVPMGEDADQAQVDSFNQWMEFIKMIQSSHEVGFVPMYGGTLVGITRKS